MEQVNKEDLSEMNLNTPLGKILKKIKKLGAIKKPEVDEELGKLLDEFLVVLTQADELMDNGMYFTGFPEAGLILDVAGAVYGKKVDVLFDDVLSFQHRNILYAKDNEGHIKSAELKKLKDRLEKHRGRKKKLHIQITDEDLQVQEPVEENVEPEIIDVEEYEKILEKKAEEARQKEENLFKKFNDMWNDVEEEATMIQRKHAELDMKTSENEKDIYSIAKAYDWTDDSQFRVHDKIYTIGQLKKIKIHTLMRIHLGYKRPNKRIEALRRLFKENLKSPNDPKIVFHVMRGGREIYYDYSRCLTYDLYIFLWRVYMCGYFRNDWVYEVYRERFLYWEYVAKKKIPITVEKQTVLESKGFQNYCDQVLIKYLQSDLGPSIDPVFKIKPLHVDLVLQKIKNMPNCEKLLKELKLNENSFKESKQIQIPLKRMSMEDVERAKIRLSQDSGFFDGNFSESEPNNDDLDLIDNQPESMILEEITFRCEKNNFLANNKPQRFKVINLILDRHKRKLDPEHLEEKPAKKRRTKTNVLEDDFCCSYEDFVYQLENNRRNKLFYSNIDDLTVARNETVIETDVEKLETERIIKEFYSNEIVVERPLSTDPNANKIEKPLKKIKEFNERLELDKIYANVEEWRQKMYSVLERLENKEFDIHDYGTKILNKMNIGESKQFKSIVAGQNRSEVIKYFVSSLQLANTNNIEISGSKGGEIANETLEFTLLSTDRYHEHLMEFSAPSIGEKANRLDQMRKRPRNIEAGEGCSFWSTPGPSAPSQSPAKRFKKKR